MGVTIDSIQIELQSNSTSATQGLDNFTKSLESLKKSGKLTAVTKQLNNLSSAIKGFSNASGASTALNTLARAIERLRSAGSIASQANNLIKLQTALKSLETANTDAMGPQMEKIASALSHLSQIKSHGFGAIIDGLSKLKQVTESLDDDTITAFAKKIELLNDKLGPFSGKMTTIKEAFGAINTKARAAASGIEKVDTGIKTSTLNMSSFIEVAKTWVDSLQNLIDAFKEILKEAIEWDGISARFGRGFGPQAQETYEWVQRLNEEMGINIQQFMKYSSVYATMLQGFGVATEDATKMALGYTELTYDIWAGYNDIYKTFDEASEAVKSAIAGEVEPIRRAGFTIVESTLEQTAANHGLEISLYNATEAQKSYLRYLTLVDQAHTQNLVGTYAKELNTAEGLTRTLAQQIKSLSQAFGSLFLPILVRVLPYVQAFVELLTDGVYWLANLFGIDIQPVDWSGFEAGTGSLDKVADSAGGATDALDSATKAAKELKNATLGIDELNVISPTSASSGSGGSGASGSGAGSNGFAGLDIDSLWDESIFDSIQQNVDEIKEKLKGWLPVLGGIATTLAGLKLTKLLEDIDNVDARLLKLSKGISVAGIVVAVGKLVWDFTGAYLEGGDETDLLKALGTTTIGVALAYWLGGKPGAALTLAVSGVVTLTKLAVEIGNGTVEWNDTEALMTGLVGGIETIIGGVLTWKTIGPIVKAAWPKITAKAAPLLAKAGPYGWIALAVAGGITLALVDYDFSEIGRTLGEKIGSALKSGWNFIKDGVVSAWNWAIDALDIDDIWDVLAVLFVPGEWIKRITPELDDIFTKVSDWLNDKIENLKGNINEFFGGFFDGLFDGLGIDMSWADKFAEFFDIEYLDIVDMVINPSSIGKHIMTGINKGIESNEKLSAIKDKLVSMWNTAKSWWDNKKGSLKTYTPNIGSIFDKLSERWKNARDWWNKKKSGLNTYTPSIGSIYDKLSARWKNARDWWNKKKGSLSYTPSIGSIVNKIKSAWNTAKSWWNKNAKLSTVLNVKVPKISVKWAEASAFGKSFKYPTGFNLKFAANGGVFNKGSLIWAGERGPEVMANAGGGKTGVMNVQQMQEAVYEGVYAAVSAAMRGNSGGGSQAVNVYLDGKQITSAVEKRQHERGSTIMGNEVYSY